jgi:hypothetical protein
VTHSYSQEGEYDVTLSITLRNLLTGGETSQVVIGSIHVHSKHVISSLPPDLEATSLVTEEDLAKTPTNTYHPVLVTKKTPEEIAIGELGVHFEEAAEDIDLSNLVAQVDLEEGKSLIYMPSWPEEIEQYKLLFVPSTGTGTVYICSDATSLEEVSLEKADLIINVGETKDSITVATTFYNGKEYYLISGVTGTGGGELKDTIPPTTLLTIGEPKYVTGITYVTPGTPFNLTATDNPGGTGVALTVYRISNSTGYDSGWLTYTKPFNFTSLGDGNYTIAYNSTDNIGNVETPNTQEITLDNTPPTTKLTISKPNCVSDATYVTIDTSFTIEATDTGSGVKSIAYKIYNAIGYDSGWRAYVGSFNLSSLNDGSYTIAYNTTDNVGNVEPSKTVDVTLVRAKWLKQDALNQLNSLVPTGNKKVDGKIMEAAGKIKQSLGTTSWIDENHPNPKCGKQVFDKEEEAVLELMVILRGTDATQAVKNKIRTVIDELVRADKEIALIAILDAKAKGSTDCRVIHEIKEAQEEYSEALNAIIKGNYDRAVEEFEHAWIRAQHAMKKQFGDVNADGKVNLIDCIILANAFGSCPGQPKWNPMADLNGDNKVDLRDCLIVCANLWNVYD